MGCCQSNNTSNDKEALTSNVSGDGPTAEQVNSVDEVKQEQGDTIEDQVEQMRKDKYIGNVMGKYRAGRTLGSGASCQVVEGIDKETNEVIAIKMMDAERNVTQKLYDAEVEILSHLSINTQKYKAALSANDNNNNGNDLDDDVRDLLRKYTPSTENAGYDNVLHFVGHGKDSTHAFVLTELLRGGELFDRIVTKSEEYKVNGYIIAGRLVKQMLEAVKYCHDHNIVHRDLKPENFVFETTEVNSNLVLIDYGCAQILGSKMADIQKIVGTAYYLAPELAFNAWYTYWLRQNQLPLDEVSRSQNMGHFMQVVRQKISDRQRENEAVNKAKTVEDLLGPEHIAALKMETLPEEDNDDPDKPLLERYQKRTPRMLKSSDVWSIGVIAYVMLTGRAPFRGRDNRAIFESIVTREWRFPAKDARYGDALSKKNVPEQFRKFLDKCLNKDPLKRATIEELLNDPFVKGIDTRSYVLNNEVLRYIKQFNYQSRLKKAITRVLAQNMTETPAKQVEMHFKRVDVNQDGKLNEDELIQVCIDSGYDKILARAMARRAIQQFDVDDDRMINIDEFKQMWYSKVLTENDNYIARVFEVFDDNGDGHIDANELRMILFSDVNASDEDEVKDDNNDQFQSAMKDQFSKIQSMIAEVDKDSDGKISFAEFFDAMTEKTAPNEQQEDEQVEKAQTVDDAVFAHFGVIGGNVEIYDQVEHKYPTKEHS